MSFIITQIKMNGTPCFARKPSSNRNFILTNFQTDFLEWAQEHSKSNYLSNEINTKLR